MVELSVAAGALLIVFGVLMYKALTTVEKLSGSSMRSAEHERRDYFALIQTLVEKRDTPNPIHTGQVHAQERIEKARSDAATEREAIKQEGRPIPPPAVEGEYATPEEAML